MHCSANVSLSSIGLMSSSHIGLQSSLDNSGPSFQYSRMHIQRCCICSTGGCVCTYLVHEKRTPTHSVGHIVGCQASRSRFLVSLLRKQACRSNVLHQLGASEAHVLVLRVLD